MSEPKSVEVPSSTSPKDSAANVVPIREKEVEVANGEAHQPVAEEVEEPIVLHNLCILPPLQKDNVNPTTVAKDAILLPTISPHEPVSAIRNALGEIRGYAHMTNYRLVIEDIDAELHESIVSNSKKKITDETLEVKASAAASTVVGNGSTTLNKKKKKGLNGHNKSQIPMEEVVSPYTSSKAAIKISSSLLSLSNDQSEEKDGGGGEIVLNDYGDLAPYVEENQLDSNTGIRMVLERYDVGSVKEHVMKTRILLDGNAPCVLRVVGDDEVIEDEKKTSDDQKEKPDDSEILNDVNMESKSAVEMKIPEFSLSKPVSVDGRNLKDFFYLACGEEERLKFKDGEDMADYINLQKKKQTDEAADDNSKDDAKIVMAESQSVEERWNEIDDLCRVNCSISYCGFNPPPPHRRLLGDLAYLEVQFPADDEKVYVTAIPAGFYINTSTIETFNPAPASQACFSHELLDCLLQKSNSLRYAWSNALKASLERSDLAATNDSPYDALFRATVRKDAKQGDASDVSAQQQLDTITLRPSWLVHSDPKNQYPLHKYSSERAEEDLSNTHGLDILTGMTRDWNEEFQSAREIPCETLGERIERARIVHKTLMDFGDAALAGAEAIFKGQIAPMNPNEQSRAHVYLHNNIFFSRAIDSGVDTFKIGQGDSCARKAASRDASCVGTFHRLDISGLNTLATVLIDYLGTRLTCQSIVPGILQGEKTHEILYGAVEATAPLSFNKDFHDILDSKLGKGLMIATRNVNKSPLTEERIDFIKERKINPVGIPLNNLDEERETEDTDGVTPFFGAIELKGIKGSDQRTYCLDISRLTPRDANWVAKESGGTGNYDTTESKKTSVIPDTLEDDEWTSAILRPELITQITHTKMRKWIESKKQKENDDKDTSEESEEKPKPPKPVESEYIDSLRMNLNVFLPHVKGSKDMAIEDADQLKKDEELVREAASYLWDTVLPRITKDIRTNVGSSIPVDGRSLTEFLHQRGVNCRYLGRLAQLALDEENNVKQEEKAVSEDSASKLNRYKMPECWLEILECEMIARAAKHVLDRYLTENGCFAASQPASEISSFLSALMITSEESAAETENRKRKDGIDDEILALTTLNINDDKAPTRGHKDIWNDIEKEIGHRFRYTLQTFNSNDSRMAKRAQYIPLLRRFCQKAGIRLKARNYIVGEKGLVSSEISYPIAVSDIVEVVPLIKHAASSGDDGFVSCTAGASAASTSLHVLLPEAKAAFDAAQMQLNEKQFANALDLAQEASTLYQRAIESPFHNRVYRCLELTSIILFQAEEFDHALANAKKALTIAIQIFGFDSKQALTSRTTLSHILLTIGAIKSAVKQQRATMYLMELMAGPRYVELSNSYHKLGTMYHEVGSLINALRLYQEAFGRNNPDRVIEGMLSKHSASILASLGQYKPALETEKRTYEMFRLALGEDHELTKNSMQLLKSYTRLTVQQQKSIAEETSKLEVEKQKEAEEQAALELGNQMVAEEVAEKKKKKKRKKKSNKKKK